MCPVTLHLRRYIKTGLLQLGGAFVADHKILNYFVLGTEYF